MFGLGTFTQALQYNTWSDPRQLRDSVRRLSSMVGELSKPDDRRLGEASEVSSSGSGNLGVARLGRMNRRTWGKCNVMEVDDETNLYKYLSL